MYDPIKAQALIKRARENPSLCPQVLDQLGRDIGEGVHPSRKRDRRAGAGFVTRCPDPGPVANLATSSPQTIIWRRPGRVLDMYGQVASGSDTDAAFLSVQVLVGGEKSLWNNGDANAYLPFFAAFGKTQNWFPLDIEVKNGEVWTCTFKNEGSGGNITPALLFSFLPYPM